MDKYIINGPTRLSGSVTISGAKNAALGIIPATLLTDEVCVLENVPNISDVAIMLDILAEMGASIRLLDKSTYEICTKNVSCSSVPNDIARKMRASYYFLGAFLGRCSNAKVPMPGGCDLGVRPIDQHIKGFESLGATVSIENGGIIQASADMLIGNQIYLDTVSVGATINIMLAAVKAKGLTIIENAAKEPHIVDLANFLNSMGGDIMGAGTDVIKIRGVDKLFSTTYSIIPDQIEAGTFMAAAAATRGRILIKNVTPKHLEPISAKLIKMGVNVEEYDDSILVSADGVLDRTSVKTSPHPGFPTDNQPQIATVLCLANGTSIITEGVWENRFRYVDELRRMGANISVDGKVAVIEGIPSFHAAPVKATDLRAGAAMIIAALTAEGTSEIEDIYHIERGYENIVQKFNLLGADIRKISVPDEVLSEAL